jgi:hypothetical protein
VGWLCWLAHLSLLRFCLRHSFALDDGDRIDKLYAEFLERWAAVPEWQGYEKPKMHPPAHLKEVCLMPPPLPSLSPPHH